MDRNAKGNDLVICHCEEVTQADNKKVIRQGATRMNEVKRLTRAGMGLCQGKTCGRLVTGILTTETPQPLHEIKLSTSRPPDPSLSTECLVQHRRR